MSDRATPTARSDGWFFRLLRRLGIGRSGHGAEHSPMRVRRAERLPSATEDISFRASLEILWGGHGQHDDLDEEAVAVGGVIERAAALSRLVSPLDAEGLERQLGIGLATPEEAGQSGIWAFAHVLGVVVRDEDLAEAKKRRALRRALDEAEIERELERAEIAYLREQVFSDLGHAVLWWLRREEYALDRLPDNLPHLDRIVQAVGGAAGERSTAEALVSSVRTLFEDDVHLQYDVIEIVCRALIELGREDEANELVKRGAPHIKALGARMLDDHGQLPSGTEPAVNGHATPSAQPPDPIAAEPAAPEPAAPDPAGADSRADVRP